MDRRFVLGRAGMGRRQAVVASKDQIQQFVFRGRVSVQNLLDNSSCGVVLA